MTKVLNETDKLSFIITQYGLNRITQALADTTVQINLTKIKVGDANFEYYVPTLAEFNSPKSDLRHLIPDGSFYIIDKELLEDGLTISLHTIFPENLENCEIREVGIYETVNDVDYLFAVSTQQPLLKPLKSLRYFIAVDYYAFLKSQNLSEIYDQIVIDTEHTPVTKEDYDNLMSTILFSESNLMEQINGNTRVIGLNRARQLGEKITEVKTNFSYDSTYNTLSNLLNFINPNNLFAYWTFDYNRTNSFINTITDISSHSRNLSSSNPLSSIGRTYKGLMPFLNYTSPEYFYLDQGYQTTRFNSHLFIIHGSLDINEGTAYSFSYDNYITIKNTYIPNTNKWNLNFNFNFSYPTEETELAEADKTQNIIEFGTPNTIKAYLDITQTEESGVYTNVADLKVQVGNGVEWLDTLTIENISANAIHEITLTYENGTYKLKEGETEHDTATISAISNYTGTITLGKAEVPKENYMINSMNLNNFSVNSNDEIVISGTIYENYNDITLLNDSRTSDISFSMGFVIEPLAPETTRTLLARSDYSSGSHIFEINEKSDYSLEIKLFTNATNYLTFTSEINTIPSTVHSLIFSYSHLTEEITAYVNGNLISMTRTETGDYTHMNASPTKLYIFSCTPDPTIWANSAINPTQLFDENGDPVELSEKYNIDNDKVYIDGFECRVNPSKDISYTYYQWTYTGSSLAQSVYTKTLDIERDTKLWEDIDTPYTGTEFKIERNTENEYVVTYSGIEVARGSEDKSDTHFAFTDFDQGAEEICANSYDNPTVLYTIDGELYRGDDWRIVDSDVYYKEFKALNTGTKELPYIQLTSYISGTHGEPLQLINSKVGVIFILKEALNKNNMRSLSLMLNAAMGQNPCTEQK